MFGPAVLGHELAGKLFDGFGVAGQEIVIVAADNFGVDSEVVVFCNKELLDFKLGKGVPYINNKIAQACTVAGRIGMVAIEYRKQLLGLN